MSTSGIIMHYKEWGCQSPNPRKYDILKGNFVFNLRDVFQERNHSVKWDLPVQSVPLQNKMKVNAKRLVSKKQQQ